MTVKYCDYVNGDDGTGDGSAGNPYKTKDQASAGLTGGDEVRCAVTPATSVGIATWTDDSDIVTLASAKTATICDCDDAWTDSANVISSNSAAYNKFLINALLVDIEPAFTTGKLCYLTLTEMDLSGYEQVSFWFRCTAAVSAGDYQIKLCSDTTGDTPVDTINVPVCVSNQWRACTVDTGGALGASIKSIALYAVNDLGDVTLFVDSIIACKAKGDPDALSLTTVISKNTSTEGWWPITGIDGTTVYLGRTSVNDNYESKTDHYYRGTTESVTTYMIDVIELDMPGGSYTACEKIVSSGSSYQSWLKISGGWDLSTQTQTGITFQGTMTHQGVYLGVDAITGSIWLEKLGFLYGTRVLQIAATGDWGLILEDMYFAGSIFNSLHSGNSGYSRYKNIYLVNCCTGNYNSFDTSDATSNIYARLGPTTCEIENIYAWNGSSYCCVYTCGGTVRNVYAYHCYTPVQVSGVVYIYNLQTGGTSTNADIRCYGGVCKVQNIDEYSSTPVEFISTYADEIPTEVSFTNGNDHRKYTGIGNVLSDESVRHTDSGLSWKFSPTVDTDSNMPLREVIGKFLCKASIQVTISAWFRRTNTGVTAKLVCKGGQISGVESDVTDSMSAAADTWEQLSVTFTPTQTGVVEIEAQVYGGTTYSVYVDDVEAS